MLAQAGLPHGTGAGLSPGHNVMPFIVLELSSRVKSREGAGGCGRHQRAEGGGGEGGGDSSVEQA